MVFRPSSNDIPVVFAQFVSEAFKKRSFSKKKQKRKVLERQVVDPRGQVSPDAGKSGEHCRAQKHWRGPRRGKCMRTTWSLVQTPDTRRSVAIAVRECAEDGMDGNLRPKDMRLLSFSRARCYRDSGIMNARTKIETWNAGMKDRVEASSDVTSRGADFQTFLKCMEVRVADWEALWKAYTKPRWARLRMSLYCGKQRAFANFFNPLNALKEDEGQRLLVAYGAGRWMTQNRIYASSNNKNVQGARTAFCHHTDRCVPNIVHTP